MRRWWKEVENRGNVTLKCDCGSYRTLGHHSTYSLFEKYLSVALGPPIWWQVSRGVQGGGDLVWTRKDWQTQSSSGHTGDRDRDARHLTENNMMSARLEINPLSAGLIFIRDPYIVITVLADVQASDGAIPKQGNRMRITNVHIVSCEVYLALNYF